MQQVAALNIEINANGASSNSTDSSSGGTGKAFDSMLQQQQSSSDNTQSSTNQSALAEATPVQTKTPPREKEQNVAEPVKPEPTGSDGAKQSEVAAEEETNESAQKEVKLASPESSNNAEPQRQQSNQAEQADNDAVAEELDLAVLPADLHEESANISIDWLNLIAQADAQKLDKKLDSNDEDLIFKDDISNQEGQFEDQDLQELVELLNRWQQQQEKDPELSKKVAQIYQQYSTGQQQESAQVNSGDIEQSKLEQVPDLPIEEVSLDFDTVANLNLLSELINTQDYEYASEKDVNEDLKLIDSRQTFLINPEIEPESELEEITEQIEILQNSASTEPADLANAVQPNSELEVLAALPEEKLDRALVNLAERLIELESNDKVKQLDLELQQKNDPNVQVSPIYSHKTVVRTANVSAEYTDFISSLKAGIAEYKQQLQQGHQPAIDLSAAVNEAIVASGQFTQLASEKVEQQLRPFAQILDLSQSINNNLDVLATETTRREIVTTQEVSRHEAKQSMQQPLLDRAVNITKPEGHQQLAERVRWMVGNNFTQADIRLDPPDLGSMQIKVSMHGEVASVSFVVQSQQARDMLDQAVPRLRELLGEKGIELGESQIHQQNQSAGDQAQQDTNDQHADAQPEVTEEHLVAEQSLRNGHLGGIDYFV